MTEMLIAIILVVSLIALFFTLRKRRAERKVIEERERLRQERMKKESNEWLEKHLSTFEYRGSNGYEVPDYPRANHEPIRNVDSGIDVAVD